MAEYEDCGPGFDVDGRREGGLDLLMSRETWEGVYGEPEKVFLFPNGTGPNVDWIDWEWERYNQQVSPCHEC